MPFDDTSLILMHISWLQDYQIKVLINPSHKNAVIQNES